jgi:hypothetical protein
MNDGRMDGADFSATVRSTCWIRCEVADNQIEYWFGDVGSGLRMYFDRPGFSKFTQVQTEVVERLRAVPDGAQVSFVVGDDDVKIHGSEASERIGQQ